MGLIPDTKVGKITFYEEKVPVWELHASAIGTTAGAVTSLEGKTEAARAAWVAAQNAKAIAKAATTTLNAAIAAMMTEGASIIKQIRAKGEITPGDTVYALAQIPPPTIPSPVGPPGTPSDLKVELKPDGSVALGWRCSNPEGSVGTLYHLYRSVGTPNNYSFIGGTGSRSFVDNTAPSDSPILYYKIQAVRTTAIGDSQEFMVRFGVGASGVEVTAITTIAPKIAA